MGKNPTPKPSGSLIITSRILLNKDARPLLEISKAAAVPFHWLQSFKYNRSQGYDASTVQRLYESLSGKKLPL